MTRAAIIVVGGAGTRLGGVAKPWLEIAGRPIIEHVLEAVRPHAHQLLIAGVAPSTWRVPADVHCVVEEPAGSGPAHGIRAGMASLDAEVDEVLLLAGDAPFIAATLEALMSMPMDADGIAAEREGRMQYLLARVRRDALQRALDLGGESMRTVFDRLQIGTLASEVLDADTWEDVARLREGEQRMSDSAWLDEVIEMLGVDVQIDVDALLSLTRDVAHNVERKNAPLTSYLVGYAAAAGHLSPAQIAELCERIAARAREHGAHA